MGCSCVGIGVSVRVGCVVGVCWIVNVVSWWVPGIVGDYGFEVEEGVVEVLVVVEWDSLVLSGVLGALLFHAALIHC